MASSNQSKSRLCDCQDQSLQLNEMLCGKWHLLQFLGFTVTALLSPQLCQVSDYSKESGATDHQRQPLSSPSAVLRLSPTHSLPCAAESCAAGGGGAEAMSLQCNTDASGDRPGVWRFCDGSACTQSTDPGGVRDSDASACERAGHTGAGLQEEKQAQGHALHSGVNAVWYSGGM